MTRETKIGLLVGLGFIVVFAMLLSHSAPTPPPGDPLQFAKLKTDAKPNVVSDGPGGLAIIPDPSNTTPVASTATPESPVPVIVEAPLATNENTDPIAHLPTPAALEPDHVDAAPPTADVLEMNRVAPPLPEPVAPPQPTVRNGTPEQSPHPAGEPAPAPAAAPSAPNATPKEYIVKKGDTLGQIAKNVYGTGAVKVIEFLMKANKEQIKNKDTLVEGKKLTVPQLPPDMFESAPNFNVAQMGTAKATNMDEMINRRAPIAPKPEPADKPDKPNPDPATSKSAKEGRTYEVQAKETLSSIAREQLGSETYWRDIQKLNKGVDPNKIKPGTKLKLPARRPLSEAATAGRSSA